MNVLQLVFIIVFPFELTVHWQDRENEILLLTYEQDSAIAKECVDTGFTFEQRYLLRACADGDAWFLDCKRTRRQVNKISHDPIRNEYTVATDLHGDTKQPLTTSFTSFKKAFSFFSQVSDLPVSHMQRDDKDKKDLSIRIVSQCLGEYSETLAQLSYLLTLGIVDIGWSDTDWIDFQLDKEATD